MAQEISLFSGYSQKENLVTNYTGLLLKMIYEENPKLFEELIQKIFPNIIIGPRFSQQEKAEHSVFDLAINQRPFAVVVETKLTDWFYDEQLSNHLRGMRKKYGDYSDVYLLLLSSEEDLKLDKFSETKKIAKSENIEIETLSFKELGIFLMELYHLPTSMDFFVIT